MFGLFNKKQPSNPIVEAFRDLTLDQKMSIMNLLMTVAICDGDKGNQDIEMQFLNTYVEILGVNSSKCMRYRDEKGQEQMLEDLKPLSKEQKELLTIASFEMINCDGRPNETELNVTAALFEHIGVSDAEYVATIKKSQALLKHFNQ